MTLNASDIIDRLDINKTRILTLLVLGLYKKQGMGDDDIKLLLWALTDDEGERDDINYFLEKDNT